MRGVWEFIRRETWKGVPGRGNSVCKSRNGIKVWCAGKRAQAMFRDQRGRCRSWDVPELGCHALGSEDSSQEVSDDRTRVGSTGGQWWRAKPEEVCEVERLI